MKHLLPTVAIFSLLTSASAVAQSLTDVGTLGGSSYVLYSTADFGILIGESYADVGNSEQRVFRWENGVMEDFGTLGGTQTSLGTNDYGRGPINVARTVIVGNSTLVGDADTHAYRWENGIMEDLGTLGGSNSWASFVSDDGSVVAGDSELVGDVDTHAYRWENGAMQDLGTLGGSSSGMRFMNGAGTVIAGMSFILGDAVQRVFRWENNLMTDIGDLGGSYMELTHMTSDGNVLAGYANTAGDTASHAFRWEGGVFQDLGTLGGSYSDVSRISTDGSVIVGNSGLVGDVESRVFRWENNVMTNIGDLGGTWVSFGHMTADGGVLVGEAGTVGDAEQHVWRWENGVMEDIGTLGGTSTYATDLSADGLVVIGAGGLLGDAEEHAWHWKNGVMTDLGTFGGAYSNASRISADGAVVMGSAEDINADRHVFIWREGAGNIEKLSDILTDAGVNIAGWEFSTTKYLYLSEDGTMAYGGADYNGDNRAVLINLLGGGLITPEELAQTLSTATVPGQQGGQAIVSGIGQSLMVARNALSIYIPRQSAKVAVSSADPAVLSDIAPAAGGDDVPYRRQGYGRAFYATGNMSVGHYDDFSNYGLNGATGLLIGLSDDVAVGAGIVSSHSRIDTRLGGHSRLDAPGVSVLGSFEPDSGWRLYGSATAMFLDVKNKRNYMNGGGVDTSRGDTEGTALGVAVRGGKVIPFSEKATVMPYAEMQWSKTKLDAYAEQGGGIPAAYSAYNSDVVTSRFGAEVSHAVNDSTTFRWRGAWGHRYGDGDGVVATAMAITQTIGDAPQDRDWAEAGASLIWRASERTTFSADLSGRAGRTGEPAVNLVFGVTMGF